MEEQFLCLLAQTKLRKKSQIEWNVSRYAIVKGVDDYEALRRRSFLGKIFKYIYMEI